MLSTGLAQQGLFCLRFALLGLGLGIFYDLLRAIRIRFRLKRRGTGLLDLLFCLVLLAGFLLLQLRGTDGRLRGYLLLGLGSGFFLWRKTLSHPFLRLALTVLRWGEKAAAALWRFFLRNFEFPRGM